MKKCLLFVVASLFLVTITSSAQHQRPSAEDMAKRETESMKAKLDLSAEQLTSVEALNLKYAKKMDEMFQQGKPGGNREEMESKMKEIETQKRDELAKVLNTEQLKKYDELVADRHKNKPGPPPQN
jgi:periplasmic protein CpxP/Spy